MSVLRFGSSGYSKHTAPFSLLPTRLRRRASVFNVAIRAALGTPSPPFSYIHIGALAILGIFERLFADPEPPEARGGILGEGCDEGRAIVGQFLGEVEAPKARASLLGEGCEEEFSVDFLYEAEPPEARAGPLGEDFEEDYF
ncbi:hypothetical protein EV121DRAFT_297385 [Schizophyllum commune]